MRRFLSTFLVIWVLFAVSVQAQQQAPSKVTIALTQEVIKVDAGFSGAEFTLFGVIRTDDETSIDTSAIDIVATISGPPRTITARAIERAGPIWIPGKAATANQVPGLFYVFSTRGIDLITDQENILSKQLDVKALNVDFRDGGETENENLNRDKIKDRPKISQMRNAVILTGQEQGIFNSSSGSINKLQNGLFTIKVILPAITPVGDYNIKVTAWANGHLIGEDSASLGVNKAGIERQIYEMAYQYPFFYGLVCVFISLFAGWAVSIAFRKS